MVVIALDELRLTWCFTSRFGKAKLSRHCLGLNFLSFFSLDTLQLTLNLIINSSIAMYFRLRQHVFPVFWMRKLIVHLMQIGSIRVIKTRQKKTQEKRVI